MTAFTERVVTILQGNGSIKEEDRALYIYGLQQGLFIILNVLTTVTIGIIFDQIWESILFMFAYFPLRSCAGGYHAKSPLRCYLFSIIMIIAVLASMRLPVWNNVNSSISVIVSSIVILFLAPVEDGNKPLDAKEIIVFKKRTKVVLCVLVGMVLIFQMAGLIEASHCIMLVLIMLSIMLVLGKIKNLSNRKIYV
ncbi:MAG: accessory gene regulator B family protein [Hungatella sp.]|jgi:accessory gene regulator B|nr:accessory gene regulator B family protein [Hungatella sp.]